MTTVFSYLILFIALVVAAAQISQGFAGALGSMLESFLELVGVNAKAGAPNRNGGGIEALKGRTVDCVHNFARNEMDGLIVGKVSFRGEVWNAIIYTGGSVYPAAGEKVQVEDVRGLTLIVKAIESESC